MDNHTLDHKTPTVPIVQLFKQPHLHMTLTVDGFLEINFIRESYAKSPHQDGADEGPHFQNVNPKDPSSSFFKRAHCSSI